MLATNIRLVLRNMRRDKLNSTINIAGLAIGMACVLLIVLYVTDELRYDQFFSKSKSIYQVSLHGNFGGQPFKAYNTPPPVGAALQAAFPEVTSYTRVYRIGNAVVHEDGSNSTKSFTEKEILAVDSNFLDMFDYALLSGHTTGLQNPHSIMLTESAAKKYFGTTQVTGKLLRLDHFADPFVVTGVLKDVPEQSSIQFSMLLPVAACEAVRHFSWSWVWCQMNTYVTVQPQTANKAAIAQLQSKFPAMVRVQAANAFKRIGQPFDEFLKKGGKWDFELQALTDVHLHSANIGSAYSNLGDIKYIYIFAVIALFIIVLACVNFMNLATAQAARRAKEVGVRKVLGSQKGQLVKQFLTEAMLYSFTAALVSLLLVWLLLPLFNTVAGKQLQFTAMLSNGIWLLPVLLTLFTGLLAGSYPAFYLTAFNPIEVLKGSAVFVKGRGGQLIRNGLVVFQFTVSIALIICTVMVFKQLQYARSKDLGLQKDNVVILPNAAKVKGDVNTLRNNLQQLPGVTAVTVSTGVPAKDFSDFTDFYVPVIANVKEPLSKDVTLSSFITDEYFIPSLQLQLLQGRNFSKAFDDSASVIVNETTVKQVGWKEPLGKYLTYPGGNNQVFKVIGVVKDFNLQSLHSEVVPFALFYTTSKSYDINTAFVIAHVQGTHLSNTLQGIEKNWKQFAADVPFEYSFLDQDFEALYRAEERMGVVFGIFTTLSILVACLGLFGLSVYMAERRTKEMGVRKVLGASTEMLVSLLSRDFLKLVFIAALIAFPLAWWAMYTWLQDFAYRTSIEWWIFVVAGVLAAVIALLTVSFQAIKAATANPAKSLRAE
ncbi:ABC transporter permease [Deminuibacter soli]|uniref:ABC transporter permease n=1 Tax=Deminuibacter soli TaxID=2291815 RepID=A0A3E1ND22_9BACT|nr:ABC transporter permease [Deminuibacter soli]RFM25886.1 ABC transporter permease [Deminuibacter soli]